MVLVLSLLLLFCILVLIFYCHDRSSKLAGLFCKLEYLILLCPPQENQETTALPLPPTQPPPSPPPRPSLPLAAQLPRPAWA